jgi:hypothetical protein
MGIQPTIQEQSFTRDIERDSFVPNPSDMLTPQEVVNMIEVDPNACPDIFIYWGTTRSGTTASGTLFASIPDENGEPFFDQVHSQPFKARIRRGGIYGNMKFKAPNKRIAIEETTGPSFTGEIFDPVEMMLAAGVPGDKITAIYTVREPLACWKSLERFDALPDPEFFAAMQGNTVEGYMKHQPGGRLYGSGVTAIPFVYDAFGWGQNSLQIWQRLGEISHIPNLQIPSTKFKPELIDKSMVHYDALDPSYHGAVVAPVLAAGEFKYTSHGQPIPQDAKSVRLQELCTPQYEEFKTWAQLRLGI